MAKVQEISESHSDLAKRVLKPNSTWMCRDISKDNTWPT